MRTQLLGRYGEAETIKYLRSNGYEIIEVNFRSRFGEIDIIAEKNKMIVFCEVKMRKDNHFAEAREFVDKYKQERLMKTAAIWLSMQKNEPTCRFDVSEVYAEKLGGETQIHYIENAFAYFYI